MQKIIIAGSAVALIAVAGFADTAQARCVRYGVSASCRHMVMRHHYRHLAMHRHFHRGYGWGYGGYGMAGYGAYGNSGFYGGAGYGSSINSTEQHNQGTGN